MTYVAGRSRAAVADELAGLLGDALVKTGNVSAEDVYGPESEEWKAELERGLDALWDIAGDRATKIQPTGDAQTLSAATVTEGDAPEPESNAVPVEAKSTAPSAPATGDSEKAAAVGQDVPFLNLATFRMLVLSSPVLESFFESDLSSSFRLEPVTPSDPSHAWHLAPSAPGAPRAVPGSSSSPSSGRVSESASYSRDVTTGARGAIAGFLGGFLGEEGKARMTRLADEVGKRLETHTVEGPRPSFGRNLTLDGTRIDTQELRDRDVAAAAQARAGKSSLGARLAGVVRGQSSDRSPSSASSSPSPLAPGTIPPSLASAARAAPPSPGPAAPSKRASLNLSTAGAAGAAETLRAATAAIQERAHFVIDEPGGGADADADGELDLDVDVDEEGEAAGQALGLDAHGTNEDEGALRGKEAEIAKGQFLSPVFLSLFSGPVPTDFMVSIPSLLYLLREQICAPHHHSIKQGDRLQAACTRLGR